MTETFPSNTFAPTPATDALDDAIDRAIAENRIVGTVVMLAEDGEVVYARAAGMADREAGREMQPGTWFRYASVSKPFTTVAALRLIADGRLSPDDAVEKWLPDMVLHDSDGNPVTITVGHLLSHMAGLDYGFNQPADGAYANAGVSDGISEREISLGENIRRIATVPVDLTPGRDWRYSVATDVLGAVIEAVTGTALPVAMANLVTDPLSLDAAYYMQGTANLATNYADGPDGPERMVGVTYVRGQLPEGQAFAFDPDRITDLAAFPSGGGGMAGTAPAALALLETLRHGDFLPDELRAEAAKNRISVPHPMRGEGVGHAWAGAVYIDPDRAGVALSPGSLSWGGIYGHCWFIDPARRRTLIALTNTAIEGMAGDFALDMAEAIAR